MESSSHDDNPTVGNDILTPNRNEIILTPKITFSTILPPNSAERVLSHLMMCPLISLDDHSPIKQSPTQRSMTESKIQKSTCNMLKI